MSQSLCSVLRLGNASCLFWTALDKIGYIPHHGDTALLVWNLRVASSPQSVCSWPCSGDCRVTWGLQLPWLKRLAVFFCRCTFQSCHVSRVNLTCVTCAPGQGVCEVDVPVLVSVLYNKVRRFDLCVAALLLSVAQGPSKA